MNFYTFLSSINYKDFVVDENDINIDNLANQNIWIAHSANDNKR